MTWVVQSESQYGHARVAGIDMISDKNKVKNSSQRTLSNGVNTNTITSYVPSKLITSPNGCKLDAKGVKETINKTHSAFNPSPPSMMYTSRPRYIRRPWTPW